MLLLVLLGLWLLFLLLNTVEVSSGDGTGTLLTGWLCIDCDRLANFVLDAKGFDDFEIEDDKNARYSQKQSGRW